MMHQKFKITFILSIISCKILFQSFAIAIGSVTEFGFYTNGHPNSGTDGVVTLTLWFNYLIFQCDVNPAEITTNYHCDSASWTVLGTSDCPKIGTPQYKILIDNSRTNDAVIIDYVYLYDDSSDLYGIDKWCISDGSQAVQQDDVPDWNEWDGETMCGLNYIHYNVLCIDNDILDCGPGQQMYYFDINQPNQYRIDSPWESYSNFVIDIVSCEPTSDPTADPTMDPTSYPTIDPTMDPTGHPTNQPSNTPTYVTNIPSLTPTNIPSLTPTNIPSLTPTNIPSLTPTNIPSLTPTKEPTTQPTLNDAEYEQVISTHFENTGTETKIKETSLIGSLSILSILFVIIIICAVIVCVCLTLIVWRKKRKNHIIMESTINTEMVASNVESVEEVVVKDILHNEGSTDKTNDGNTRIEIIENKQNDSDDLYDENESQEESLYDNHNHHTTHGHTTRGF